MRVVLALSAIFVVSSLVQNVLAQGMYSGSDTDLFFAESRVQSAQANGTPSQGYNQEGDPYEGIDRVFIDNDHAENRPGTLDAGGVLRAEIHFQSLDNPIVDCLIAAGVLVEDLLHSPGLNNGISGKDLPASQSNEFYGNAGVRLYGDHERGYTFDLNLSYKEGSSSHDLTAEIGRCAEAPLVGENARPRTQPQVIPASAPAVNGGSTVIDI